MDLLRITPVSIAPLAELMFSLVITFYFLSIPKKTFDTWLVTLHSGITTCMFAANFITTATLQSDYGPDAEKLQYIFVASLALFNLLFAYLFGIRSFKKEMIGAFSLLLVLFATALYFNKIAFPYTLPVYILHSVIVISVFVRKASRVSHAGRGKVPGALGEAWAYRGFAICFLFNFLVIFTANLGIAGIIPSWWMLLSIIIPLFLRFASKPL